MFLSHIPNRSAHPAIVTFPVVKITTPVWRIRPRNTHVSIRVRGNMAKVARDHHPRSNHSRIHVVKRIPRCDSNPRRICKLHTRAHGIARFGAWRAINDEVDGQNVQMLHYAATECGILRDVCACDPDYCRFLNVARSSTTWLCSCVNTTNASVFTENKHVTYFIPFPLRVIK